MLLPPQLANSSSLLGGLLLLAAGGSVRGSVGNDSGQYSAFNDNGGGGGGNGVNRTTLTNLLRQQILPVIGENSLPEVGPSSSGRSLGSIGEYAYLLESNYHSNQLDPTSGQQFSDKPLAATGSGNQNNHHLHHGQPQPSTWALLVAALFQNTAASHAHSSATPNPSDLPDWQPAMASETANNDNVVLEEKWSLASVNWPNLILAIILIMLMLTTAIGNLFVIVAILIERNLQTIGNYLVLSLAIADLLVACLVMPLASIYQILDRWTLGVLLCDIWTSADVFCCTGM